MRSSKAIRWVVALALVGAVLYAGFLWVRPFFSGRTVLDGPKPRQAAAVSAESDKSRLDPALRTAKTFILTYLSMGKIDPGLYAEIMRANTSKGLFPFVASGVVADPLPPEDPRTNTPAFRLHEKHLEELLPSGKATATVISAAGGGGRCVVRLRLDLDYPSAHRCTLRTYEVVVKDNLVCTFKLLEAQDVGREENPEETQDQP